MIPMDNSTQNKNYGDSQTNLTHLAWIFKTFFIKLKQKFWKNADLKTFFDHSSWTFMMQCRNIGRLSLYRGAV